MIGKMAVLVFTSLLLVGLGGRALAETAKASTGGPTGGAFNLRILSDSVPDLSSRENFVSSALSAWPTDAEKALAQFRWMHRLRRVGTYQPEDSRPVLDPVLFFQSYGITYCSMIAQINSSLWEAWGKSSRVSDLRGHVVSEVFYDNAWHLFDNDFCNYYLNERGAVASIDELENSRIHGNVEDLKPGEFYVFDTCPTTSSPRGRIIMGPSSWSIIEVARDWYPGPGQYWPRPNITGSHAGHRYILGVRPNETYTRYWRPLQTGEKYARPLNGSGLDPAEGSVLRNSRGNGLWSWTPDLGDSSTFFAAENIEVVRPEHGGTILRAQDRSKPAAVTLRVMAANVVTSANLTATVKGPVLFFVSENQGLTWEGVAHGKIRRPDDVAASTKDVGLVEAEITTPVAGRLEYLLKAQFTGAAELYDLHLVTVTQVNQRTLPALTLGKNEIVAVSDEHLEYVTFNPRLADQACKGEAFRAEGWQSIDKPHDWEPSVRGVEKSELVLRATAPRDIQHVRMAGTLHLPEPGTDTFLQVSFDSGKSWKELKHIAFPGAPYDQRVSVETRDIPPGTREVLMKYAFDWGGNGIVNVVAEVGYLPAGPPSPYHVTYCWSEYRDRKWVKRYHVEHVNEAYHRYAINVGGARPPRMEWVRVGIGTSSTGNEPDGGKPGYSGGEDVGERFARPGYHLTYGKKISSGCSYTMNRPPSEAYPDCLWAPNPKRSGEPNGSTRPPRTIGTKEDPRTLTDDYIGLCDFWGGSDINLTGPKNQRRVGELVAWPAGDEVVVTLDLGKVQTVGGATIAAHQPNKGLLYPATMTVERSLDGKTYSRAGATTWEECFFPPAGGVLWEGHDSPVYDDLPAGGIRDYKFAIPFEKSVEARYVRFRLAPPTDPKAGIALWELEVFDRLAKSPWSERVSLPEKPQWSRPCLEP
jgi:hypothetical protein